MKRKPYPSDLSDSEWKIIEPLLPKPLPRGPKANVDLREVVNGILYLLREGCSWRAIPHDLPPWQTVSSKQIAFFYTIGFNNRKTGAKPLPLGSFS
ncbi:MAG: transposase [Moorea sp. SIO3F7]|nr:transposase [Moorena sp. SIO3E8]NEQ01265.1 transposase [Moorena sp. SIO3F7]